MSPLPEDLDVHLGWVGCLDLVVEPIKLMLHAVLGGGVQHLRTNAGCRWGPGMIVDWVNVWRSGINRKARVDALNMNH